MKTLGGDELIYQGKLIASKREIFLIGRLSRQKEVVMSKMTFKYLLLFFFLALIASPLAAQEEEISPPPTTAETFTVSPDGNWLAYLCKVGTQVRVCLQWLSGFGGEAEVVLASQNEAVDKFLFSPDGNWIFYGCKVGSQIKVCRQWLSSFGREPQVVYVSQNEYVPNPQP